MNILGKKNLGSRVLEFHSSSTQQVLFGLINPNLYDEIWNDIYFPFEIGCWPQKCVLVRGLAFYQLVWKKNGKSTGTGTG